MFGNVRNDVPIAASSKLPDFGASHLYATGTRAGDYLVAQNLHAVPKPAVANIYNQAVIQLDMQLPPQQMQRPLSRIKSSYAVLPTVQQSLRR